MTTSYKVFAQGKDNKIKKTVREKRDFQPKGSIGKSVPYGVWVMPNDVDAIKRAINTFDLNFVATLEAIISKTGMPRNRVLGTIDILKEKGIIEPFYTKDGHLIYQMK